MPWRPAADRTRAISHSDNANTTSNGRAPGAGERRVLFGVPTPDTRSAGRLGLARGTSHAAGVHVCRSPGIGITCSRWPGEQFVSPEARCAHRAA